MGRGEATRGGALPRSWIRGRSRVGRRLLGRLGLLRRSVSHGLRNGWRGMMLLVLGMLRMLLLSLLLLLRGISVVQLLVAAGQIGLGSVVGRAVPGRMVSIRVLWRLLLRLLLLLLRHRLLVLQRRHRCRLRTPLHVARPLVLHRRHRPEAGVGRDLGTERQGGPQQQGGEAGDGSSDDDATTRAVEIAGRGRGRAVAEGTRRQETGRRLGIVCARGGRRWQVGRHAGRMMRGLDALTWVRPCGLLCSLVCRTRPREGGVHGEVHEWGGLGHLCRCPLQTVDGQGVLG